MLQSLKRFVQPHDIAVTRSAQNVELLHDLSLGLLLRHELLIYGLQGYKLAGESVDGKINLAESTLAHDFAYLVVLCLSLRRHISLKK